MNKTDQMCIDQEGRAKLTCADGRDEVSSIDDGRDIAGAAAGQIQGHTGGAGNSQACHICEVRPLPHPAEIRLVMAGAETFHKKRSEHYSTPVKGIQAWVRNSQAFTATDLG